MTIPAPALAPSVDVEEDCLTPTQVVDILGVTQNTLAAWRYRDNGPPYYKVGKLVRYSKAGLRVWLGAHFHEGGD